MRTLNALVKTLLGAAALAVVSLPAHADAVPGQGTWETTLKARDINGDSVVDAYYDTALDVTWLANWDASGLLNQASAVSWATGLNVYGVTGWRLPNVSPVNGVSFQDTWSSDGSTDMGYAKTDVGWGKASEMGHMFYVTLGNKGYCTPGYPSCVLQPGRGLSNTGNFVGMHSVSGDGVYWNSQEYAPEPNSGRMFDMAQGGQGAASMYRLFYAVAVHPGDVTPVPEPQTVALMLAGLCALAVALRLRPR